VRSTLFAGARPGTRAVSSMSQRPICVDLPRGQSAHVETQWICHPCGNAPSVTGLVTGFRVSMVVTGQAHQSEGNIGCLAMRRLPPQNMSAALPRHFPQGRISESFTLTNLQATSCSPSMTRRACSMCLCRGVYEHTRDTCDDRLPVVSSGNISASTIAIYAPTSTRSARFATGLPAVVDRAHLRSDHDRTSRQGGPLSKEVASGSTKADSKRLVV
jgi:hypothetical protein